MGDAGVKDTTAYRISRQIMDHIYGEDEDMSESDFAALYKGFHQAGGSWEALMDGDMRSVDIIESCISMLVKSRGLGKIAARLTARRADQ